MCADVKPSLMGWASGTLDVAACRRVEAHIALCSDCAREAAEWRSARHAADAFGSLASAPLPAWRAPDERAAAITAPRTPVPIGRPARAWLALAAAVALATGATVASIVPDAQIAGPQPHGARHSPPSAVLRAEPTLALRAPTPVRRLVASAPIVAPSASTRSGVHPPVAAIVTSPVRRVAAPEPTTALPTDVGPEPSSSPPEPPPGPPHRSAPVDPAAPGPTPDVIPTASIPPTALTAPSAPSASPPDPTTAPVPTPAVLTGVVTGVVTGPDAFARAEVRVIARPVADGVDEVETTSGADGRYTLTLAPGAWSIAAEGAAYVSAWNGTAASPLDVAPLSVAARETVGLDFRLTAAPPGRISGRVVDAAGVPVPGALVVAAAPDVDRGGYTAFVAATLADGEGRYRLAVDEGAWLVGAAVDWRAPLPALAWWGGDGDIIAVDQVPVARQRPADGIDFRLRVERGD